MVSELISGRAFATEAGTQRYVARHGPVLARDAFNLTGQLQFSSLGIGTYLGAPTDAADLAYEAAVVEAVRRGVNVIDTAANYRQQRSERLVGRALAALQQSGEIYRSELLVATKAGFVPQSPAGSSDPLGWAAVQTVGQGLCDPDELVSCCHCMAPAYLRHSLLQSLDNLGLATVDVFFIHNPETQLQTTDKTQFYDRLRRAFVELEAAADASQLRVYGLATWSGLRAKPEERDYVSLAEVVATAESVAGSRHRFRAIQLPLNLAMPEAFCYRNQLVRGEWLTVLEAAQRLGLAVFTSAPLHQGKLSKRRLPHVPDLSGQPDDPHWHALQFARSAPGVTVTLIGMGQADHVTDNLQVLKQPRAPLDWLRAAAKPCSNGSVPGCQPASP
jgi:aryl-alcohol dehydrogenase-like predicted oxidoreductase